MEGWHGGRFIGGMHGPAGPPLACWRRRWPRVGTGSEGLARFAEGQAPDVDLLFGAHKAAAAWKRTHDRPGALIPSVSATKHIYLKWLGL